MSNVSGIIKSIQDIMRKDVGVDGDAQRISQLVWMFFLKILDDREDPLLRLCCSTGGTTGAMKWICSSKETSGSSPSNANYPKGRTKDWRRYFELVMKIHAMFFKSWI